MDDREAMSLRMAALAERRKNFIDAAHAGVQQMASQYGAKTLLTKQGFVVVMPNDDRMHFDVTEF